MPKAEAPAWKDLATRPVAAARRWEDLDTVRVRMSVDLTGPLGEILDHLAERTGKSRIALLHEGMKYVFAAIRNRKDGFVGA